MDTVVATGGIKKTYLDAGSGKNHPLNELFRPKVLFDSFLRGQGFDEGAQGIPQGFGCVPGG